MGKRIKNWASMKGHFQCEGILMIGFPAVFVIGCVVIVILVQAIRGGEHSTKAKTGYSFLR